MYQIYYDGSLVYDPRLAAQDPRYRIEEPELHLAVGSSGRLSFAISEDHPMRGIFRAMSGVMEVRSDGTPIFRGRIIGDTSSFFNAKKIDCEEKMACFNDSVVEPFTFPDQSATMAALFATEGEPNIVAMFLDRLITNHNSQVGPDQQIQLGEVTVTDPNNYISRSSDHYVTTWEVLDKKLQKSSLGGYLMLRYTADATYLDYVKDFPLTNVQRVSFASNLIDMQRGRFGGDLYTAILPVGKDGLTIESLPDGPMTGDLAKSGRVIVDTKAEKVYGRITHIEPMDDVTLPENLRSKAAKQLAQQGVSMPQTIRCKACDLAGVEDTSIFRIGRYVEVVSQPHGISASYPLMEICIKMLDPGDTEITLSHESQTITSALDNQKNNILDLTQGSIEKKGQEIMDTVKTITENYTTSIEQTANAIVVNALKEYATKDELKQLTETVRSQLKAAADEYQLSFTQITEEIERVEGDTQRKYNEITVWFRTSIDGLEIGKSDSSIKLILKNDRMSFVDNGYEVAYFAHNRLYVTSAEFLTKIVLGNFAWVVREAQNVALVKEV